MLLLVLSLLLPTMLGAGWLIAATVQAENRARQATLRDTTRAVSMAVERELAHRAAVAQVLSQSPWLEPASGLSPEQIGRFAQHAARATDGMAGGVVLRSADRVLLDTRTGPPTGAIDLSQPLVSVPSVLPLQGSTYAAPDASAPAAAWTANAALQSDTAFAAVVHPVMDGGQVVMNLLLPLRASELQRAVDTIPLPAGWEGRLIDDRGTVVALQAAAPGPAGSEAMDGAEQTIFVRPAGHGWSYVGTLARPRHLGLAQPAVVQVTLASLLLLALSLSGAVAICRSIVGPVGVLKSAAARLQGGLVMDPTSTGITEYDEVKQALQRAAEAVDDSRAELAHSVNAAIARTRLAEQRVSRSRRVEALGRLTGGVAHDFNNLLGVISNSAHLIGRHACASDFELPLGATRRAVESGQQLTQQLVRFAGRTDLHPGVVLLSQTLPELHDLVASALGRLIRLDLEVAPATAAVGVHAGELELALVSLAVNAREAMPDGGVLRVTARNARLGDLDTFADAGALAGMPMVLITVRDSGAGFSAAAAERAFEPYFTSRPFGQSAGLGLSQVHGFCTQAGGAVHVASTPGFGSTVLMLLPAASQLLASGGRADTGANPEDAPPTPSLAGQRVLLAEDNAALADVTALLLRDSGAIVVRARNAAEAWRLACAERFDVVLTDVVMPGEEDGLALARRLREAWPNLAVVLISGYSEVATAREFPCLHKPAAPADLIAMLSGTITERAKRAVEVVAAV
ncbi:response regulator [Rubrivivax sp. RP6-9]|uniref:hybrid sensor histidine kinase/response regulator n=1 Tax=Rubrivivax sp. RP6-9 TaxID=3415750 RepID=UPI003CC552A3